MQLLKQPRLAQKIFLLLIILGGGGVIFESVSAAPIITATKTDMLVVDNDDDGEADPGDVISYTVQIQNTGTTSATNVVFTDTLDANTTLVGGSLSVSPLARNDSYTSLGNVGITVPDGANDLLANDNDPDGGTVTLTGITGCADTTAPFVCPAVTVNGGDVTLNATGAFTYNPPPGFEGTDTFTYNIIDDEGDTDPATVTITVSEVIWFVDNSVTCSTCDGRLGTPFNGLTGATGFSSAADEAEDIIFIYETGSGNYTGGVTLENNQILIGQGTIASIATIAGLTVPPFSNTLPATGGSRPTITNNSGNGITLAQGNTVRGLNVGNTSGVGISDNGGTVGSLTISEVSVTGTGGGFETDNGGTLNVNLDELSASSTGSNEGIHIVATGSFNVSSGAISSGSNSAVIIDGNPGSITLGVTLTSISSSGGGSGIDLEDTTGSFTVTGDGTNAANGSGGTLTNHTADAVSLTNVTNISLAQMNITGSADNGIFGSSVTNFDLSSSLVQNNTNAINEAGVHFDNLLGTATISNTTVSGSTEHNIDILNNSGTLTLLTVSNSTIQNNSAGLGADGIFVGGINTAVMNVVVEDSTFNNNQTDGIQADVGNTAEMDFRARRNSFTNGNIGLNVNSSGSAQMTFEIDNNTAFSGNGSFDMNIFAGNSSTMDGEITNNSTVNSGEGVRIIQDGNSTLRVLVDNNDIDAVDPGGALTVRARDGSGRLDATITNNVTTATGAFPLEGIFVDTRDSNTVCADIQSNTASSTGADDILVEKGSAGSTFILPGILSPFGTAQAISLLSGQNTAGTVGAILSGGTFSNGTCNLPVVPVVQTQPHLPQEQQYVEAQPEPVEQYVMSSEQAALSTQRLTDSGQRSAVSGQPVAENPQPFDFAPFNFAQDRQDKPPISTLYSRPAGLASPLRSGENFSVDLGVLDPGQVVTIEFRATIDNPLSPVTTGQVCNQGSVSGTGFADVSTDDPDVGGAADPTCTTLAPGIITISKITIPAGGSGFGFTDNVVAPNNFSLNHGGTQAFINVIPGAYVITETTPAANFGLDALSCDDGSSGAASVPDVTNRRATVNVEPGEIVTCIFTNTRPALSVSKSATDANGGRLEPGDTLTYTIVVSNTQANSIADNVVISDTIPANTSYVANSITGGDSRDDTNLPQLNWTITSLPANAPQTLNFAVTVSAGATGGAQIINTAGVTSSEIATPVTDQVTSTIEAIDLELVKLVAGPDNSLVPLKNITVDSGDVVTYALAITNSSAITLPAGSVVSDTFPTQVTANGVIALDVVTLAGNLLTWTLPEMAPNAVRGLVVTATVKNGTAGQVFANMAVVAETTLIDTNLLNNTNAATVTVRGADLEVGKTVNSSLPGEGDTITYTVGITNNGPDATGGVVVSDPLPLGLTLVNSTTTQGSYNPANGLWTLGAPDLPGNGATAATLQLIAQVDAGQAGQTILNMAAIDAATAEDAVTANNTATITLTVQSSDLSITKSSVRDNNAANPPITYTITVINNGPDAANNAVVTDNVPAGIQGATWSWSCAASGGASCPNANGGGSINETIPVFPNGGQLLYTVVGTVVNTNTIVTNTATITTATGLGDPAPDNNNASDVNQPGFGPGLGDIYLPIIFKKATGPPPPTLPDLRVTAFSATPLGGRTYRFNVTVVNNGTAVAFGNNFHIVVYDVADLNTPLFFWGVQGSDFGAGQSVALSQNYTFPGGVNTNLRAWADPFNVVVESNDGNNTLDLPIVVTGLEDDDTLAGESIPGGPLPTPTITP